MFKYSIIIPAYNEELNIIPLIEKFAEIAKNRKIELVFVNNGSTDNTENYKETILRNHEFVKWIKITNNEGYGHGIMQGLKTASGDYIGYTHADLQTDPNDIERAIQLIENQNTNEQIFLKGQRIKREFLPKIFSLGFEFFTQLILKEKLNEINAQPTIFHHSLLSKLYDYPKHWGFDLFVYFTALKSNFKILRIPVIFTKRIQGRSKWNTGLLSRFKLSYLLLRYCFKLKKQNV